MGRESREPGGRSGGPAPRADIGLPPDDLLPRLLAWSLERPDAPALLHKRRNRWRVFVRREIQADVARLTGALRGRGLGPGARLAISGALEPDLIVIALAAHALGVAIHPVARSLPSEALRQRLTAIAPSHAFVQGRRTIARWLAAPTPDGGPLPLYTSLPLAPHPGPWLITPLWPEPLDVIEARGRTIDRENGLAGRSVAWIDDGAEWPDGLGVVLQSLLAGGAILAIPETSESATRDRREIRPTTLLASPERQRQLADELAQRLPQPGSLRRRLYDAADVRRSGLLNGVLRRLIDARLNAILRLPRQPATPVPHGSSQ